MLTIVHEIDSTAAVRALSEHRAPKKVLRTIPVQEFRAPVALVRDSWELDGSLCRQPNGDGHHLKSGIAISEVLEMFRRSEPGEFTTRQAFDFISARGWLTTNTNPTMAVTVKLGALVRSGVLIRLRQDGHCCIWKFPANP